ncbi:MAG TPA: M14 family zinc carboxypeptidase [Polyangiaceae bacterium]|nr:M14 family zinc carboxypeptidase [Polyangiaceae bacterium]
MGAFHRVVVVAIAMFGLLASAAVISTATAQPGPEAQARLELYQATVDEGQYQQLANGGYDIAHVEETVDGFVVQVVLRPNDRNKLRREGFDFEVVRNEDGLTATQAAALQAQNGFTVWRPWDGDGGIEQQLRAIAEQYPKLAQLHTIGTTHEGRDILALRVTSNARNVPLGVRPAVLYQATAHAREWIATEVNRRLMLHYLENADTDQAIRNILATTELWFVPVMNPDGYQYTFDVERLWRKNLRDNDDSGTIDSNDGVDLNRNFPEHWKYDEEGSSSLITSDTYRGPAPGSEPETVANMELFDMADFRFAISYHSYGQLLLYTAGWQVQTPSADDPIYVALTGTDADPAVEGFDPGPGADLYITNGEFTDWAHATQDVLAWTPELSEGCEGCNFVFPDDEELVQEEFERNLQFALNVARSARTPDDPVSHMGISTKNLYLDVAEIDPWKTNHPSSDLKVEVSHGGGSTQPVEVLAKKSLPNVKLHYRINGGQMTTLPASPSPDGETFGGNNAYNAYYQYFRAEVSGLEVGDTVEYWFSGGGESTEHVTFDVVENAGADVLILAQEDRTGASNVPGYTSTSPDAPNYLEYFEKAIADSGRTYAVWDVDAEGRQAPDHLGVLSHYDAVVWYTGNDFVTRTAGRGAGNVDRMRNDLTLELRAYLNEGGKLLYNGQWAGALENGLAGTQLYDPVAGEVCVVGGVQVLDRCQVLSDKNDFQQYWLGSYIYNSDAGTDDDGNPFSVDGVADPYTGLSWEFNGADSAQNHVHTASLVTTSSVLGEEFPHFAGDAPAVWSTGLSGVFEPFDGDWYVYSNMGDVSYKQLMRTIDLTGIDASENPTLTFRFSYDTEPDWDFVFVEAHTVDQDDWTTLPDENGHTSQSTGQSCLAANSSGWRTLHPHLDHYQTQVGNNACDPTGTTGEWNASSGRSAGWEEWSIDLSEYAGSEVEVAISYASDWAVQGLGAFVDLVEVSTEAGAESFETGLGAWIVSGPPPGSGSNPNNWERTESVGFEEGAVASTADTLFFGFGLEGITGADSRTAVMDKSLDHLFGD